MARLDKVRPIIVLTRDPMGRFLHSVIAAPVTSTVRGVSTEVEVGREDGIRRESVANLDHTQLISRSHPISRLGRVRPSTMTAICDALAIAVDCDSPATQLRSPVGSAGPADSYPGGEDGTISSEVAGDVHSQAGGERGAGAGEEGRG